MWQANNLSLEFIKKGFFKWPTQGDWLSCQLAHLKKYIMLPVVFLGLLGGVATSLKMARFQLQFRSRM